MKFAICDLRFAIWRFGKSIGIACVVVQTALRLTAADSPTIPAPSVSPSTTNLQLIDLAAALRLAGAQNLDIQIAREKLTEARAAHDNAVAQFFPWLSPGVVYRRHDNSIQDVAGNVLDVHKESYAPGVALSAQVDFGETIYRSLATKQLSQAAAHAVESERQNATLRATQGYFDLALAQGVLGVAIEAVNISTNYEAQIRQAVSVGIAFKGDQLRVQVQSERNRLAVHQAIEQRRVASARLAQTLHLDPVVELMAVDAELTPISLVPTNRALDSLVQQALVSRPELKQSQSFVAAAQDARKGVVYGPLIPSLAAQAFGGGLGGRLDGGRSRFGEQEDYTVGFGWRIGPGGLFDFSRKRIAESRLAGARLSKEKVRQEIVGQVVESAVRVQSLANQIATSGQALAAAEEGLRLAQQRKEFAVGIVLEAIQAEQDLTRARNDYLRAVAEFNKGQYALSKAIGSLR